MIAEIYGKIRDTGPDSNLTERSEDELTGNFFGNMRYIPFNKGLKRILKNCIYPSDLSALLDNIDKCEWAENILFWQREKEAEIDVLLEFDSIVIGIEVKYLSGLSSDDDADNSKVLQSEEKVSSQQLAHESRLIKRLAGDKTKLLLLLSDESAADSIYTDTLRRKILDEVEFGYITWQKVLIELQSILGEIFLETADNSFESVIIGDLVDLLIRKGFERFNGFSFEAPDVDPDLFWTFDYKGDID